MKVNINFAKSDTNVEINLKFNPLDQLSDSIPKNGVQNTKRKIAK